MSRDSLQLVVNDRTQKPGDLPGLAHKLSEIIINESHSARKNTQGIQNEPASGLRPLDRRQLAAPLRISREHP
jgi:hypothetical protein